MLRKPGLLRGGVGRTEPHDFEGRSVELAFGLLPVAAVDEKRGSALRHAQAGGAAREAREPGNGLPVFGNVFREMRIDDAADPGVKPPVLHGLSKFAEPFGARLVHDDASDEESPEEPAQGGVHQKSLRT